MKNLLFLLSLSLSLSLTSCASADKMLEKGDYDGLIRLATNKLSGKKKKDVYVRALEEGFEKITRQDLARIEGLQQKNTAENWENIIRIADNIQRRQDRIEPFLPLVSETGYRAKFNFVETDEIITEARTTAVNLYEKRLDDMIQSARKGNKRAARDAYDLIGHIRSIGDYYYGQDLRDEMKSLGLNRILVRIENNSNSIIPAGYADELLSSNYSDIGGSWDRFYTEADEDMPIDYKVVLKITDISTTRDEWSEHVFPYTKEIVDGWEYVLDGNGNVMKDSLGNDIKRNRIVRVNATVVETIQSKTARVRARMEVFDAKNGTRVHSKVLEAENCFTHTARNFFGDERALDKHLRQRIYPMSYPSDSHVIREAFRDLKPKFFHEVRRADYSA